MIVQLLLFGLTFWLGLYLLARNYTNERVRWTGFGLVAYAIGLAVVRGQRAEIGEAALWVHGGRLFAIMPALLWGGALLTFLPPTSSLVMFWQRIWYYGVLPIALLVAALGRWLPAELLLLVLIAPLVGLAVTNLWSIHLQRQRTRRPLQLALAITILMALAVGMVLASEGWLGTGLWWNLAIGIDLLVLGYLIATVDAWEQGERLGLDVVRSLDSALLKSILYGGPVVAVMIWKTGYSEPMVVLLYTLVGMAILVQEFDGLFNDLLDSVAFAGTPQLRVTRHELRETAKVLPRVDTDLDLDELDSEEFVRLTRRALSQLGNLPRLATSPLTNLRVVRCHVSTEGADQTIARAQALKQILTASILHLKPVSDKAFGTTDEWRHYNALYFPYVVGLKPFSRRVDHDTVDPVAPQALAWFQSQVPERTLYNWQSAAAELVAQHLAELDASACRGE